MENTEILYFAIEGCAAKVQGDRKALVAPQGEIPLLRCLGYFVPTGTTKGLCGRPLETFAAQPMQIQSKKNRLRITNFAPK